LYIYSDDDEVSESFRGLGIRIEDDVLVTGDGYGVMTAATPKSIADVEALTAAQ
jgi:Xaa-Pro aminopeptidase